MKESSARERLARLETRIEELTLTMERFHKELLENNAWQQRTCEALAARLMAVESSSQETRTHLRWMKAIWIAVQGSVLAWLGLK